MRFLTAVVFLLLLISCASTGDFQKASSGFVGCDPNEIVISDRTSGMGVASWKASCKGKTFHCSGASQAGISCKEMQK